MREKTALKSNGARMILRVMLVWIMTAITLLLVGAVIFTVCGTRESVLAYFSSAISFLAAGAAGVCVTRESGSFDWKLSLICAAVITVILLMIGFLIAGQDLSPDGVISVVSFSFAGVLAGGLLAPRRREKRHSSIRPQRRSS